MNEIPPMTETTTDDPLLRRARTLGLWGIVSSWDEVRHEPWLPALLEREERERARRSLERRQKRAKLSRFKPLSDFDWSWPKTLDRAAVEELLTLRFIGAATNVLVIGSHGTGKTMIAKNIANYAVLAGHSTLFVTAHTLLNDLAEHGDGAALLRRIRHYTRPDLLVIDELGYLATSHRHADLLFHVVNDRYQTKPIIVTTNKPVTQWEEVFPGATSLVGIVDRLVHNAEILNVSAESFRLKEANERSAAKRGAKKR